MTSLIICGNEQLADQGVLTINKEVCKKEDLLNKPALEFWNNLTSTLQCETLCVKPARDGCSTGVARLWSVYSCFIIKCLCASFIAFGWRDLIIRWFYLIKFMLDSCM